MRRPGAGRFADLRRLGCVTGYGSPCVVRYRTHDTWAEFTRQRAELPADLQIVGWYHTHPHWGVFLSAWDLFICEHFFSQPADVALVIDPCQGDRGFFQWANGALGLTRRTGGFYVFASRQRAVELSCLVAYLENKLVPSF